MPDRLRSDIPARVTALQHLRYLVRASVFTAFARAWLEACFQELTAQRAGITFWIDLRPFVSETEMPLFCKQHRELRTGEQRQSLAAASPSPIDPLDPDPCPAQRYQGVFADTSFSDSPSAARRPADDFFEPPENEREAGVGPSRITPRRGRELTILPLQTFSLDISA